VQVAGGWADELNRFGKMVTALGVSADFVDLNCGCPIDAMCNRSQGAALMRHPDRLLAIAKSMCSSMPDRSVTIKVRTGWDSKKRTSHVLVPRIQRELYGLDRNEKVPGANLAALFMHGRSRQQRYSKLADWEYIAQCAKAQDGALRRIPLIGNGDIFSYQDWQERQQYMNVAMDGDSELTGLTDCAMIGRGVLVKPWLPTEIHEKRHWDISASERLDIVRMYANFGLEHYGSDTKGVETTRRFMLEWLSFLYRYVPVGLIDAKRLPQRINQVPPCFTGRCDTESLLASPSSEDWVRITEMFLGPRPDDFVFIPRHRSNAYPSKEEERAGQGQGQAAMDSEPQDEG